MKRRFVGVWLTLVMVLAACSEDAVPTVEAAFTQDPTVFINELHYDNDGTDVGEAIEIAGPAGIDLTGWSVVLYNGANGASYNTRTLSGSLPDQENGYGTVSLSYPTNGIQNGSPDGLALVNAGGTVVQLLSYEGDFTAVGGPADGLTSTDIGVAETSSTPVGFSLQLTGTGTTYQDFTWSAPKDDSFGAVNEEQTFGGGSGNDGGGDDGGDNGETPPTTPAVCGDEATLISAVQGSGAVSPIAGENVTLEGIVVGDFQENDGDALNTDLDGFYLQEEVDDQDRNPATSEGIFVFAPDAQDVAVGDTVRVAGEVTEFNGLTELADVSSVTICGGEPVEVAPVDITLPLPEPENGVPYLERFEGMLVRFPQELVISEYFNFDRFGEIVLARPLENLERPYQPTSYVEPGPAATSVAEANAQNRITLDDGRSEQNPDPARHPNGREFTLDNRFRGGDTVTNTTGILDYRFDLYRMQPTQGADYEPKNPRPETPEDVGGSLTVASFNVLNYFTTLGSRGADNQEEFGRQATKIVAALKVIDADVFGLIEIENNGDTAVADLVGRLNAAVGTNAYDYIETGTIGTDAIKVAFIYKPATVTPVGDYAILDASVDARFDTTRNRPALAQTFRDGSGGVFTAVVNHLKSKGSGCGAGDDDPQQGNCNGTRTAAAQALVDWLRTDPTGSGDPDALIIGDLNAYDEENPIDVLRAGGYTDLVEAFEGEFAYSYLFGAQFGHLDYALANEPLLAQVTGTTEWHINADEPDILDYDTSFKKDAQDALYEPNAFRSSDHDPIVVGLELSVPTLEEALEALQDQVQALSDTLNRGQLRSLQTDLDSAERHLGRGQTAQAVRALGRFEDSVRRLIRQGALTEAQGQPLVDASSALRARL
jgi:uncharacterized protein